MRYVSFLSILSALSAGSLIADGGNIASSYGTTQGNPSMPHSLEKGVSCADITPAFPCPNYWRFSGDYLYLLPTVDDTYFVIDSPVETATSLSASYPNGKRKNNDFGFHSGFRVGAEFAMCHGKRELEAYYTYFSAHKSRHVSGDFLSATLGPSGIGADLQDYPGTASSKLNLLYERLDVDLSQHVVNAAGVQFYVKTGLEYAYTHFNEKYLYSQPSAILEGFLSQKSKFWGIGPQFGLGVDYNFYESPSCESCRQVFSITGLFSGSLLVGQRKGKVFSSESFISSETGLPFTQLLADIKDEKTTRIVPALHGRVGLSYTVRSQSAGFTAEVGYEFNSYIRGLTRTLFINGGSTSDCLSDYYNFDVQGLYASAGVSF